jgi:AmmeMemoRadiSam system protein A
MPELGASLLEFARAAIAAELEMARAAEPAPDRMAAIGATFVTLRRAGELRGCIGTVDAWRPLADDVRANAVAAAFRDPRFTPLTRTEFSDTTIEVSLLASAEPVLAADEAEALVMLRPGIDGVILEFKRHRATFLPQVWEQLPEPRDFLDALRHKAGLPARFWSDDMRLSRYAVAKFAE